MNRTRTLALATLASFAALVAVAGEAAAHVTVTSPGATQGRSDQTITFRVPVEKASNTVGVTIVIPASTPIASMDVAPIAGWTHAETTSTLATPIKTDDGDITSAVSQVSWRATAGGLKPGEYGSFTILAGQLPDAPSITFKALQTYADGSVVRWIETAAAGSTTEPEHPAPVLNLTAGAQKASGPSNTFTATKTSGSSSNTGPIVLSIVALVVAAAALGVGFVSRARGRAA